MSKQVQKAGDNSSNIQADQITIRQGLSYSEAKALAIDVFRSNFYELSDKAYNIATQRAEEVTERFLKKLQQEYPDGFKKAEDPDFQYALFTVQKEHARSGDEELGDLLVDILVDRSKCENRNVLQIVLNESLNVAPKLTLEQIAILGLIFLLLYTKYIKEVNHESFGAYLDSHVKPFVNQISKNIASYQHLEYSGCGSISIGQATLEGKIGKAYQGLFQKGFTKEEFENRDISIGMESGFVIPCFNDREKFQIRANSKEMLQTVCNDIGVSQEDKKELFSLFDLTMNDQEIKEKCVEIRPYMEQVFDVWTDSAMKNFTLTSVGIAIGHANIKRLVGEFSDLGIWIH